jgi:hypothetical protein
MGNRGIYGSNKNSILTYKEAYMFPAPGQPSQKGGQMVIPA